MLNIPLYNALEYQDMRRDDLDDEIPNKDRRIPFGHEPEHRSELLYPPDDEKPASEPTKTELLIKALRDQYEARSRIHKIIFDLRAQGIEVE